MKYDLKQYLIREYEKLDAVRIYPPEPAGFIPENKREHRMPEETGFYGNLQDWERHYDV